MLNIYFTSFSALMGIFSLKCNTVFQILEHKIEKLTLLKT